jgi:hypothetical protein
MDGSEYLLTSAEVAVALAGFSALVLAIRQGASEAVPPGFVATLVERCLVAVILSFLPILLSGLSVSPSRLWLASSGLLSAYLLSLLWRGATLRRRVPMVTGLISGPLFLVLYLAGVLVLVLQVANALGVWISQSVWWYLVGLTWLLASVCYLFYLFIRGWTRAA